MRCSCFIAFSIGLSMMGRGTEILMRPLTRFGNICSRSKQLWVAGGDRICKHIRPPMPDVRHLRQVDPHMYGSGNASRVHMPDKTVRGYHCLGHRYARTYPLTELIYPSNWHDVTT